MKKIVLLLVLIPILGVSESLDNVFLFNKQVITGQIVEETDVDLTIKVNGRLLELEKQTIYKIVYANGEIKVLQDNRSTDQKIRDFDTKESINMFLLLLGLVILVSLL